MHNPIIPGYNADPFVYRDGGDYYLVATAEDCQGWDCTHFLCYHSTDLQHWSEPREIFHLSQLSWASIRAWAPTLLKHKGHYYLAFAAEQQIGVAVCDAPMGRYEDAVGKPLIEYNFLGVQAIDPSLFEDEDGRTYLIWGSGKCFLSEIYLSPDGVHLIGDIRCLSNDFYWQRSADPNTYNSSIYCEAPDLMRYNGRYLLTFSVYDTRDYRYAIRYAWSDNVFGPYIQPLDFEHDNFLVHGRGEILGTGAGNAVVMDGELYALYHRYALPRNGYHREICCDRVSVNGDHLSVEPSR